MPDRLFGLPAWAAAAACRSAIITAFTAAGAEPDLALAVATVLVVRLRDQAKTLELHGIPVDQIADIRGEATTAPVTYSGKSFRKTTSCDPLDVVVAAFRPS